MKHVMTQYMRTKIIRHFKGIKKIEQMMGSVLSKHSCNSCLFCNIAQAVDIKYKLPSGRSEYSYLLYGFSRFDNDTEDLIGYTPLKVAIVDYIYKKLDEEVKMLEFPLSDKLPGRPKPLPVENNYILENYYNERAIGLGGYDKFIKEYLPKVGEVLS